MKTIPVLLATIAFFLLSCGSGSSAPSAPPPSPVGYDNALPKGRVADTIVCKNQAGQSYALYLPSYYTPDKSFPCIYFFDAHARGVLPVKMYKDLAEKYGFVFVSSNISKNGMQWPETSDIVNAMMVDAQSRINIDTKRIYTAGFSGGARVACSAAILNGGVAGVVGCAAGFPRLEQPFQNKFAYFGLVGDFDFNLAEMEQLGQAMEQNGFPHQLLTFEGKHDWPPYAAFNTALLWLEVNAMKEKTMPRNDTIIAELKNDYEKRIAAAAGDPLTIYDLLHGLTAVLDGLADVADVAKRADAMTVSVQYRNAIVQRDSLRQQEATQQQDFQEQFATQPIEWWTSKIQALKHQAQTAKERQVAQMNQRLLNFLGLIGYLSSSHAINTGDLAHAESSLAIFKMADPANPDVSYLTAQYYMKKGDARQALASLNEAARLGYSETATILADPAFSTLQGDPDFDEVVRKVKVNMAK